MDAIRMIHDVYQVFLASHPDLKGNRPLPLPLAILCTSSTAVPDFKTTPFIPVTPPLTTGRPAVESGHLG